MVCEYDSRAPDIGLRFDEIEINRAWDGGALFMAYYIRLIEIIAPRDVLSINIISDYVEMYCPRRKFGIGESEVKQIDSAIRRNLKEILRRV